jgi:RNA polymerase sigma-70 factor (ECF subfamily)
METASLVGRAQNGDDDAFRELVLAHYDGCWRYARRALAEPSDAEDVVQEAFVRAHRALVRYVDRGHFRAWLFQILVNECRMANRSAIRRRRRFPALADGQDVPDVAAPVPEPEPELHGALALAHALAGLEPEQREAIVLKYGEGLEYKEIARITGASESALKMRVKRGIDTLRRILGTAETIV